MGDKDACLEPNLIVLNENVWFNIRRCCHRIVFLSVQMLVLPEFKGGTKTIASVPTKGSHKWDREKCVGTQGAMPLVEL